MKKKILLMAFAAVLSASFLACGSKNEPKNNNNSQTEQTSTNTKDDKNKENTNSENDTKKSDDTKKDSSTKSTLNGKSSTITSPLEIGQTGVASKYAPKNSDYHDVDICLSNVIRGDAAKKIVDDYNSKGHAVTIGALENSQLEYAVGEYTITLPSDFPSDEYGPSEDITSEIKGKDDNGVVYNGVLYVASTWNIPTVGDESRVIKSGVPEKGRFIFAIPKGCTDYIIALGEYDKTIAYFKGK